MGKQHAILLYCYFSVFAMLETWKVYNIFNKNRNNDMLLPTHLWSRSWWHRNQHVLISDQDQYTFNISTLFFFSRPPLKNRVTQNKKCHWVSLPKSIPFCTTHVCVWLKITFDYATQVCVGQRERTDRINPHSVFLW